MTDDSERLKHSLEFFIEYVETLSKHEDSAVRLAACDMAEELLNNLDSIVAHVVLERLASDPVKTIADMAREALGRKD